MKIALVSIPPQLYQRPSAGIAYLKGTLNKEGFDSKCFDLNFDFFNTFGEKSRQWLENGTDYKSEYKEFLLKYAENFRGFEWIGLSLFSYQSQTLAELLLICIKELKINSKIVLGGNGILNKMDSTVHFGKDMIEKNLADHYIIGEGDQALPSLLRGDDKVFPQMDDLSNLPYPDYSDLDLKRYEDSSLTATGSRGCVRNCTFCDISLLWPKYKYRPGREVAEEVVHLHKKYNVDTIVFSDSLVNGSLKEFRIFCKTLAEIREKENLTVRWVGQFIFRSGMTSEDWDNIKLSGAINLICGVESGSEKVRWHMKKKFDNRALYESIKALGERKIPFTLLLMTGYPTETEEDHRETLKIFKKLEPYAGDNIVSVNVTQAFLIAGTEMAQVTKWHGQHYEDWKVYSDDGIELDTRVRIKRWLEIMKLVIDMKFKSLPTLNDWFRKESIRKLKTYYDLDENVELIKELEELQVMDIFH